MSDFRLGLPLTGFVSFLRAPVCGDLADLARVDADIGFLGVPYDEGSGWMTGQRFAPRKIREMTVRFAGHSLQSPGGFYDIEDGKTYLTYERGAGRFVDCGDSDIVVTNVKKTFDNVTRDVRHMLRAGLFPVTVGGDHAITFPILRAFEEKFHVVHFDAHMDYRPLEHGLYGSSGQPLKLASLLPNCGHIVQIGIRSLRTVAGQVEDSFARGNEVITVRQFRRRGYDGIVKRLPKNEPVYVTVDIDVLDPPFIPGCASAELNGLTYDELRQAMFAVARSREVIGFDVTEVNPMLDLPAQNTSFLAAQLIVEFLGRVVEHPGYRKRHPFKRPRRIKTNKKK